MIHAHGITLRRWKPTDIAALVRYANNRNIWINLKDRFPHPYTQADAEAWIARCGQEAGNPTSLAIELNGTAIGGIGFDILQDVQRLTAEIGFWLAEPFWGRGIATTAVKAATPCAFSSFRLERIQAAVFEWNAASARVLEKTGYKLEAKLRRSIVKDGRIADALLYVCFRE
jgi:[ribosomal protein S5]-alanine N-acetyltransferase